MIKDAYGVSKWEAEQALREIEQRTGMEVVIIRPPMLYGPGVKANFLKLVQLVDLICCCLEHPAAGGNTFLASDGDDVSTPELIRRIALSLGKPARLWPMPVGLMKLGGRIIGKSDQVKRLCGSLEIDSSKVRLTLGWTPVCTMEEELERTAEWYKR
jgi:nucleoside-diphosphate-sugar epimerase